MKGQYKPWGPIVPPSSTPPKIVNPKKRKRRKSGKRKSDDLEYYPRKDIRTCPKDKRVVLERNSIAFMVHLFPEIYTINK